MDADPILDLPFGRQTSITFDHPVLHLDRAPDSLYDAAELYDTHVASPLDDATVMHSDRRICEITAEAPQARERAFFVGSGKPAVSNDVGHKDRCKLPGLAHCVPPAAT
jgi:hypothetical protein